jgi:hypothetical protein
MGKISQWSGTFTKPNLPIVTFDPTYFGANLVAWYKADVGTTLNGALVTGLADQSASANALAAAVNHQLTLQAAMQNSLPGLLNNETLSNAQYLLKAFSGAFALAWERTQNFSIVIAFKMAPTPLVPLQESIFFGSMQGGGNGVGWALRSPQSSGSFTYQPGLALSNNITTSGGAAFAIIPANKALVAGNNYILQAASNGSGVAAGITLRLNGVNLTPTIQQDNLASLTIIPASGNFGFNPGGIFGGSSQNSYFEAIVVNRLLTAAEQSHIDLYFNTRWAIY